jgi:hypothetical protein
MITSPQQPAMQQSRPVPVTGTSSVTNVNLRVAQRLSALIVVLGAIASAGGLFMSSLYRGETAWVVPQNRGQDLITLLAMPILAVTLLAVRRGSARATLAWIGLLGYVCYTYAGAAFAFHFNEFFLIYVALFSLSIFALIAAFTGIDVAALRRTFDTHVPRRAVSIFLAVLGCMLTLMWVGQIIPFLTTGTLPDLIVRAAAPTNFVYVLDLGLVVPLALLGAFWLWRDMAWGYVVAGYILIKALTMGLALLGMTWFTVRAGEHVDPFLSGIWVVLATSSLGMTAWFLRHCRK